MFGLFFGLEVLTAVIGVPITLVESVQALADSETGLPGTIIQTLVFVWLFFTWERRRDQKHNIPPRA